MKKFQFVQNFGTATELGILQIANAVSAKKMFSGNIQACLLVLGK